MGDIMKRLDAIVESTEYEPRPYQSRIVEKTIDYYNGDYVRGNGEKHPATRSVLIESPTGSGKTCMGFLILLKMQSANPDMVFGWVAMRRHLLSQAATEAKNRGIDLSNISYVSMFDKYPETLVEAKNQGKQIMLMVDEAHHDAASSMAHLHNLVTPDYILGVTATPQRQDKAKLCFEVVVKDAGIHSLIQEGWLSKFYNYVLPKWDVDTVLEHYCRSPESWGKSVFYFLNLDQCEELGVKMREREAEIIARLRQHRPDLKLDHGVCEVVTGSSSESEREEQLRNFREGRVACLINCMVLTEGFDDDTLETAWVRPSGMSPTMQMAGRAFRMHPEWKHNQNERFKFKKVVQSKDTRWPITKTASPELEWVWMGNEWRSIQANPHVDAVIERSRQAIATIETHTPDFILARRKKKSRFSW